MDKRCIGYFDIDAHIAGADTASIADRGLNRQDDNTGGRIDVLWTSRQFGNPIDHRAGRIHERGYIQHLNSHIAIAIGGVDTHSHLNRIIGQRTDRERARDIHLPIRRSSVVYDRCSRRNQCCRVEPRHEFDDHTHCPGIDTAVIGNCSREVDRVLARVLIHR